jgi:hypothetical protein
MSMKFVGVLLAVFGWAIPVVGLTMTQSTTVRLVLCLIGLSVTLFGILSVLNGAHQKHAIWKS